MRFAKKIGVLVVSYCLLSTPSISIANYSAKSYIEPMVGIGAAVGFGLLAYIFDQNFFKGKSDPDPRPGPCSGPGPCPGPTPDIDQLPVILTESSNNLLSINGNESRGKIVVKNGANESVSGFSIAPESDLITVDMENSSCYGLVLPGNKCEFIIKYTGSDEYANVPVKFTIGDGVSTSDYKIINAISMPLNRSYQPFKYATKANGINTNKAINSFATIIKNGAEILFIGTDGDGVFKTTDRGETWSEVNNSLADKSVKCLHSIDSVLYAGTGSAGVFQSADGGISWEEVGAQPEQLDIMALQSIENTLYAGTGNGVYRSADGGSTWEKIGNGLNFSIKTLYSDGNVLYAGTSNGGVFEFNSDENMWINHNSDKTFSSDVHAISKIENTLYAGTGNGVYKSDSVGSWGEVGTAIQGLNINSLCFLNGNLYAATQKKGVYRLLDGGDWLPFNSGITTQEAKRIFTSENILYVSTHPDGVFAREDNGNNWVAANNGLIDYEVTAIARKGGELFIGTDSAGIFKSNDDGANWKAINNVRNDSVYLVGGAINTLHVQSNGYIYAGTEGNHVFFSSDDGSSWNQQPNGIGSTVKSIVSIGSNLYAGTSGDSRVYTSANNGVAWSSFNDGSAITSGVRTLIAKDSILYVGNSSGIFKNADSTENGWEKEPAGSYEPLNVQVLHFVDENLYVGTENGIYKKAEQANVESFNENFNGDNVQVISSINNEIYAGTSRGLYKSPAETANWRQSSDDLISTNIKSLYPDGSDLYIGTLGGGVFLQHTQ